MSPIARLAPTVGVCVSLATHAALLLLSVSSPPPPPAPPVRVRVELRPPVPPPPPMPPPETPAVPPASPRLPRRHAPEPSAVPEITRSPAPVRAPVLVPGLSATSSSPTGSFAVPAGGGVEVPAAASPAPGGPGGGGGLDEPARVRSKPVLDVPDAARTARIEGSWTILVDVDADGHPVRARVASPIGWGLDEACAEAWMRSRWRSARSGGAPVASSGNPVRCTVKEQR